MRIVIFGTGGVGGNFGGYLAKAGNDVTFIARGEHLRAMKEHGLRIEAPMEQFVISPVQAIDDPSKAGEADVIFICTKAWQLEEAAEAIKPMLGENTFILPLQNSVEAADFLASLLGEERVLGGLCYTQSYIIRPGVIHGNGGLIIFGERDRKPSERTQALKEIISAAPGLSCENSADIHLPMWKKFSWISSASAVGAATRSPSGIWRKLPETRALFETILKEIFAVAHAQGVKLGENEYNENMAFLDKTQESFTTSMQRDMMSGWRSELEYQIGAVVRIGKKRDVATPLSRALYAALLPQEQRAQGKLAFSGDAK